MKKKTKMLLLFIVIFSSIVGSCQKTAPAETLLTETHYIELSYENIDDSCREVKFSAVKGKLTDGSLLALNFSGLSPGQEGDNLNGHGAIMVVSGSGNLVSTLKSHDVNFHSGSFSPDGKWLAYIKAEAGLFLLGEDPDYDNNTSTSSVWVMDVDGKNKRKVSSDFTEVYALDFGGQIYPYRNLVDLEWSPTGNYLFYQYHDRKNNKDEYIVNDLALGKEYLLNTELGRRIDKIIWTQDDNFALVSDESVILGMISDSGVHEIKEIKFEGHITPNTVELRHASGYLILTYPEGNTLYSNTVYVLMSVDNLEILDEIVSPTYYLTDWKEWCRFGEGQLICHQKSNPDKEVYNGLCNQIWSYNFFDDILMLNDGNKAQLIENRELRSLWFNPKNDGKTLFPFVDLVKDLHLENYWHLEGYDFYSRE